MQQGSLRLKTSGSFCARIMVWSGIFRTRHMMRLVGHVGIGHVRYPTAGTSSSAEAQTVLCQFALRDYTGPQRQPDQYRRVGRRHFSDRSAAHQYNPTLKSSLNIFCPMSCRNWGSSHRRRMTSFQRSQRFIDGCVVPMRSFAMITGIWHPGIS